MNISIYAAEIYSIGFFDAMANIISPYKFLVDVCLLS